MTATFSLPPAAVQLQTQLRSQANWQDMYRTLLLAAKHQPALATKFHTRDYQVEGCEAQVWLKAAHSATAVEFQFASSSRMIYALTYAALLPLQGQPRATAYHFNIERWLQECNLVKHLAPSRSNGLYQIIRTARASLEIE